MDQNKMSEFIKKLRKEKNITQQELADMIPVDRSVVSKWERGEAQPPVDKIILLSNIFNVSIDEMISGERVTKENQKEQKEDLSNFLIKQESKYKKAKRFAIITSIIALLILVAFLSYYFIQTFNTEKVYKVYGTNNNYTIKDGILMVTRENTYFKIGGINDDIYEIILIYKKDGHADELYKGSSDSILVDFNEYDGLVNNSNINNIKDNLYIVINGEDLRILFFYYLNLIMLI